MKNIAVLVVDDQPDVRMLLRLLLDSEINGVTVAGEAASGQEAIDMLEQSPSPTIIVLDHMMPGLTGIETGAIIKADHPDITLVLCTAYLDDEVNEAALAAGFSACVPKHEIARVPEIVRRLVRGQAP